MDEKIQKLITELKQVSLTKAEKNLLRQELLETLGHSVLKMPQHRVSWRLAFASLALLLVIGSGVSLAAEQALPGEPLYAIKTQVNEPVVGWLANTPEKKVALQASLVEKRLEEAEQLDSREHLTPQLKAEVKENVVKQVAKLKSEESRRPEKTEIKSDEENNHLNKILEKHGKMLEKLDLKDHDQVKVRKDESKRHQEE